MNVIKTVAKNTVAMMVMKILNPIFSVVLVISIAKYMGASGLGKYSLILSFFAINFNMKGRIYDNRRRFGYQKSLHHGS